jgi:hypothetical protein
VGDHKEVIRLFIQKGLSIYNIITHTASVGQLDVLKYLMAQTPIDVDSYQLALKCACQGGHIEVVSLFLQMGIISWPSFVDACRFRHGNIALMLLKYQFSLTGYLDQKILNVGLNMVRKGINQSELIDYLVTHGADTSELPLHYLCHLLNRGKKIKKKTTLSKARKEKTTCLNKCLEHILCDNLLTLIGSFVCFECQCPCTSE